jgi:hypothetical protein
MSNCQYDSEDNESDGSLISYNSSLQNTPMGSGKWVFKITKFSYP